MRKRAKTMQFMVHESAINIYQYNSSNESRNFYKFLILIRAYSGRENKYRVKIVYLLQFFNKQGSNGKNVSSLSKPPKARESSDSSRSSKMKASDTMNKPPALACLRNSETTDGRHTCSHKTNRCKHNAFDTLEFKPLKITVEP